MGNDDMVSVELVPMTDEEYETYRRTGEQTYARSYHRAGMPWEDAVERAANDYAKVLPDGLATPDTYLWTAKDGNEQVGMLWLKVTHRLGGDTAFGYDFLVREDLRRRGYGRAVMLAAEQWCRRHGIVSVGLHVFAHNSGAIGLYEQMGFVEVGRNLERRIL
jgi:GNAT superfamily N-acetyltransferase